MRLASLSPFVTSLVLLVGFSVSLAKPLPPQKKEQPAPAFKPIEIKNELDKNDPNDPKIGNPAKKYTVKLNKDKTYVIDLESKDFDAYLRLLDKAGKQLAEDDDGGGDLNARILHSPAETGDYQIVVTTLDGQLGKFSLKVREFILKGEAKAREVGKDGISITANINQNDETPLAKLGKVYSVQLKAGQTYTIDLASATMDSYLYVFDGKSKLLAQDDDSGGNLDSRITLRAKRDGVYHIVATTLEGTETGEFVLKIRKND